MKHSFKLFLKTFIICSFIFAFFIGIGYFYLNESIKETDNKAEKIPYSQTPSENKGVLLCFGEENIFLYLDFIESKLIVSLKPEQSFQNQIYGYSHDYTVSADKSLIVEIVDNIGGVELEIENQKLRYTGLQVKELLNRSASIELRRDIIKDVCKKIYEYGVDSSFFSSIINLSDTSLKFSECYFWKDYLPKLCANTHFID